MISIPVLSIQNHGFRILNIQNYFDLTTALSTYHNYPLNGGISVIPELEIQDIAHGFFYLTQICTLHELKILTDSGKDCVYSNNGTELKDTESIEICHYHTYQILNNQITDMFGHIQKAEFYDIPFLELFPWWKEVNYTIRFQTWFQYSNGSEAKKGIKPILSFEWGLAAHAAKENDKWNLNHESFSSDDEINKSVVRYDESDPAKIPCHFPHLMNEVQTFTRSHPELQSNYTP
ncbi:hypothetical protein SAMN05421820_101440 [Pedobacter steynii]|uniref:Uncharacterized protein n=1 Tax=Pedobacter steynii TaxID=430522 RepID=A0A1G9K1P7_9SPHI|nr:hypothetical protein [Pedobacter steynii]NQX38421.1 hypothetical protein [Pedobacter steynii]SDL43668.1 hypothetical protein SAMN05421820_101440 [Pedobacter steynii]